MHVPTYIRGPFNLSETPRKVKVVLNTNKSRVGIGRNSHFYEESLIYHSSKVL